MGARRLAVALVALLVAGCGGRAEADRLRWGRVTTRNRSLLAHLYAAALRTYGTAAHVEAVPDPLAGLDSGAVDVVPGFTGRLLDTFAPGAKARAAAQVYRDMVSALPEGVAAGDYTYGGGQAGARGHRGHRRRWGGRDVTAAVRNCDKLKIGRCRCSATGGRRHVPGRVRGYPDGTTLFEALRTGQVNAVWTTTADRTSPSTVVLADRTSWIRAENVVPLYRRNELSETQVLAINEVAGVLDTAALVQMRRQVAAGADPGQVADAFLAEHPLGATSR